MGHHLFNPHSDAGVGTKRTPARTARLATLGLESLEARDNPAALYVVPGAAGASTALDFGWLERGGAFFSEIGVYEVDDASGAVNGIAPGDPNYASAALAGATTVFARGQGKGARSTQSFEAGTVLGFYMVQNSTRAAAQAVNPGNAAVLYTTVFFSFAGASPDGFDHTRGSTRGTETVVRFEDGLRGGDRDFNDSIIRVRAVNPNLTPGGPGQITPAVFQLNQRKTSAGGELGVYAFDDASGTVDGVAPGSPGYAAAVLRSARRTVLFSSGTGAGAVATANLPAAGTFGFYLIRGASAETFLQANPTNSTGGNLPVMFFSQSNANPDATVHVRQNTNALFFEDQLNGGDQDFNDAVVSFVYGTPFGAPTPVASPVVPAPAPVSPPAPTAPTVSAIADQTINQNTATPALAFTVGSPGTSADNLTVTAASSNPTLVPNANVVVTGTGANRSVTVTPAVGQTGTSAITLTVTDGTLTATTSFNVTVRPVGAPNFTAANPPTAPFSATSAVQTVPNFATFVPGVNGGTTATYVVSAVSNTGLFSAQPAVASNGTLTYTPVAGGFGTSTFAVRVSDGVNTSANQTFTITVSPTQGVTPTTIPGANPAIDLANAGFTTVATPIAGGGTVANGTRILDETVGTGPAVARGDLVRVQYTGYLLNGTVFDSNNSMAGVQFRADITGSGSVIPGFAAGLVGMQAGGTRVIDMPSYLAYGNNPPGGIPANARLVFRVTVVSIP